MEHYHTTISAYRAELMGGGTPLAALCYGLNFRGKDDLMVEIAKEATFVDPTAGDRTAKEGF